MSFSKIFYRKQNRYIGLIKILFICFRKRRRRVITKDRVSKKTESPPLFLTNEDKLENADLINSGNTASASKDRSDNTRLQDSMVKYFLTFPSFQFYIHLRIEGRNMKRKQRIKTFYNY